MYCHETKVFDLIAFQTQKFCWKWFEWEAPKSKSLLLAATLSAKEQDSAEKDSAAAHLLECYASKPLRAKAEKLLETCEREGTQILTWSSPHYPAQLRSIYRPPLAIFARTNGVPASEILSTPSAAVVGSRKADSSGITIAKQLSESIAHPGVCVVSGLAVGIDAAAHRGALNANGKTVAVLGHGLNYLYPASHEPLAAEILEQGGVLLSQFAPDTAPLPGYFLERNRVIAGLSRVVVVVQATARSGSLATARFGLEEGREVLVVPGSIDDPRYDGSNALLKQGAGLVTSADDILGYFPECEVKKVQAERGRTGERSNSSESLDAILSYLRDQGPTPYEELKQVFSAVAELEIELIDLELAGALQRLPGNVIAAVARSQLN